MRRVVVAEMPEKNGGKEVKAGNERSNKYEQRSGATFSRECEEQEVREK